MIKNTSSEHIIRSDRIKSIMTQQKCVLKRSQANTINHNILWSFLDRQGDSRGDTASWQSTFHAAVPCSCISVLQAWSAQTHLPGRPRADPGPPPAWCSTRRSTAGSSSGCPTGACSAGTSPTGRQGNSRSAKVTTKSPSSYAMLIHYSFWSHTASNGGLVSEGDMVNRNLQKSTWVSKSKVSVYPYAFFRLWRPLLRGCMDEGVKTNKFSQ